MEYVAGLVIVASMLIYVFEALRRSPPPQVQQDMKELASKLEKAVPVEYLPFLSAAVQTVKPLAENAEKVAITEAKKLLREYAEQTATPLDDQLCDWLEKKEAELNNTIPA